MVFFYKYASEIHTRADLIVKVNQIVRSAVFATIIIMIIMKSTIERYHLADDNIVHENLWFHLKNENQILNDRKMAVDHWWWWWSFAVIRKQRAEWQPETKSKNRRIRESVIGIWFVFEFGFGFYYFCTKMTINGRAIEILTFQFVRRGDRQFTRKFLLNVTRIVQMIVTFSTLCFYELICFRRVHRMAKWTHAAPYKTYLLFAYFTIQSIYARWQHNFNWLPLSSCDYHFDCGNRRRRRSWMTTWLSIRISCA